MFQLSVDFIMDSPISGIDTERLGPFTLNIDKGGDSIRQTITLDAINWATLYEGDGTPWFWFLANLDATNAIEVGFGSGELITLEPQGAPAIWTGSQIPYAKGAAGTPKLLYWIVEEA